MKSFEELIMEKHDEKLGTYQGVNLYKHEIKVLEELEKIIDSPIPFSKTDDFSFYSNNHRVISLRLYNKKIKHLPESIGQLTHLELLFLSWNQITNLPESIGQLTSLKFLSLEGNQLTELPKTIEQLTQLQFLYLGKNQLVNLPESIGILNQLQTIRTDEQISRIPHFGISKIKNPVTKIDYLNNDYIDKMSYLDNIINSIEPEYDETKKSLELSKSAFIADVKGNQLTTDSRGD